MSGDRAHSPAWQRRWGIGLIVAGVVVNPWVLGWILAPDGTIDGERRLVSIALFQVFCLLSGVACLWTRPRAALGAYIRNLPAAVAAIGALSLLIVGIGAGVAAYRGAHHHTVDVSAVEDPTPEQRRWAADFVRRSLDSAHRNGWFRFEQAQADAFEPLWDDRSHHFNREFLFDDSVLDPDRPEFLMYRDTPRGKLLVGFMFFTRTLEERGPQPGGALTTWHYHPWGLPGYCAEQGLLPVSRPDSSGSCPDGVHVTRSAEMLHVWFIDHPLGPYADAMIFPDSESPVTVTMLHPVAVHFGLALLVVAVALDLAGRVARKPQLHTAAFVNLLLGAVAVGVTVAAGMAAEVQLLIAHDVHQVLDTHKALGFATLAGVLVLAAWRLMNKGAFPARGGTAYLATGLLTAGLALGAGYRGAELVYVHGVAVQAIDREALERYEQSVLEGTLAAPGVRTSPVSHAGH